MKPINKMITASYLSLLFSSILASPPVFAKDPEVSIGGAVEVEYGSGEDFAGTKSSDVALATVEVAFDAKINDKVTAHLGFLHEEDDTAYEVDEGYITLAMGMLNIQAGQLYVPFGAYDTNVVSDPLTLEIGETRESVLMVSAEMGSLQASLYMYNGDTMETGSDDKTDQMGARIAFVSESKSMNINIGIDYINNIADSDALTAKLSPTVELKSYVPAQIIHASLGFGGLNIIVEHLMADAFDASEIAFKGKGAEITSTNIDLGYTLNIAGMESTVGLAMQTTEEAVALGLPEEKMLVALSMGVYENTGLSFEYANSTDYAISDGGTGKDATSYTVQLAVEF